MTERRFHRRMFTISAMIVLTAIMAVIGIRAEMTRDEVHRSNSACARAAGPEATRTDMVECDRFRREARLTEPLADACIIQRRTLRSGWYQRITKCPPLNVPTDTVRASP